jgi:hypothetical protein
VSVSVGSQLTSTIAKKIVPAVHSREFHHVARTPWRDLSASSSSSLHRTKRKNALQLIASGALLPHYTTYPAILDDLYHHYDPKDCSISILFGELVSVAIHSSSLLELGSSEIFEVVSSSPNTPGLSRRLGFAGVP